MKRAHCGFFNPERAAYRAKSVGTHRSSFLGTNRYILPLFPRMTVGGSNGGSKVNKIFTSPSSQTYPPVFWLWDGAPPRRRLHIVCSRQCTLSLHSEDEGHDDDDASLLSFSYLRPNSLGRNSRNCVTGENNYVGIIRKVLR